MKQLRSSVGAFAITAFLSLIVVLSCRESPSAPSATSGSKARRLTSSTATFVSFVQAAARAIAGQTLAVPFDGPTTAGNLVVVAFDYTGTTVASITDSQGNTFAQVGSEATSPGGATTRMYYAKNIKGGAETVTVNLAGSTSSLEVYVAEYSGADPVSPLDVSVLSSGPSGILSVGPLVTTADHDMIVAYCVGDTDCHPGPGFAARSTLNSNLLEDELVGAAGSYPVTATAGSGFGMVAAAFKPQEAGPAPVDTVTVSPSNTSLTVGGTQQLTATTKDANGNVLTGREVVWTTSNFSIATVSNTGLVTGVTAGGPVTISAISEGKIGTATVTITPVPVASVVVAPPTSTISIGATTSLTATLTDAGGNVLSGRAVTWSSSNAAVATVSATGVVTGVSAGAATITAASEGQSGSATVTVLGAAAPVKFVQANAKGQSKQTLSVPLNAATKAGGLVVVAFDYTGTTFTSITDSQGNAFTQVGSEVTSPGGAATRMYYAKNIKGGAETVTVSLGGITSSLEIYVAEYSGADQVSPLDGSAQNQGPPDSPVTSGSIVTTTANDMLVAYCVGDTYCDHGSGFTARSTLHSNLLEDRKLGAAGTYAATGFAGAGWGIVGAAFKPQSGGAPPPPPPVATVSVAPPTASVAVGGTQAFVATTKDANGNVLTGRSVAWSTSNSAVAAVSTTGVVTGVAVGGPVTISATSEGKVGTASVTVTSTAPAPVATVAVTPGSSLIAVGFPAALAATLKDATDNVLTGRAITWSSNNTAVATVSGTGIVTGIAAGSATITATSEGQSGSATVAVPSAAMSGPLHVSSLNPRYFTDATGRGILLSGSHTWTNFQDASPSDPPTVFDFPTYLDFLTSHHHNFTELWRWEQVTGNTETSGPYFYAPAPYLRTGPGNALDGKPKFDLSQFDPAYLDRMRQRVIAFGQRGIYVSIMLFDGWSISNKGQQHNAWPGHPYNKSNNVNGIDGDPNGDNLGEETHTLQVPAVSAMQDAYVRRVIDAVNDLDNVLYEVSNESTGGTAQVAWQQHIISLVHQYEAGKPKQHPVGMTALFPSGNDGDLFASAAEFVSPAAPGTISDTPTATGAKVILHDTDHICGSCGGDGPWVWKSFTRGVNPVLMDVYDGHYAVLGNPNPNNPAFEQTRVNMGYVLAYASRMHLAAMPPHGELASTGYCLANPVAQGAEYLVYLPSGGSVTVNLSAAQGTLTLEWFNPTTGVAVSGGTTTGGASRTFTAPSGAAVLYIR